jgi:hypothetical protein
VSALFLLKQLEVKAMGARNLQTVDTSLSDELFVTFLPIRDWKVEKDVKAWYTIEPNDENSLIKLSNWDWIGLCSSFTISNLNPNKNITLFNIVF